MPQYEENIDRASNVILGDVWMGEKLPVPACCRTAVVFTGRYTQTLQVPLTFEKELEFVFLLRSMLQLI